MGVIVKTDPSLIRPSQDFIKEDTLNFIKHNYKNGNLDKLPPTPIVRKDENGNYVAIDGHNLLAFYSLKGIECDVYVAESNTDLLEGSSEMVIKRNKDLEEKYDLALKEANLLASKGIKTITDLCNFTKTHL